MSVSYRNNLSLGRPSVSEVYRAMTRRERVWFWVALGNFALFAAIAVPLGGNALNGTVRNGHYFLMQGGVYTEVSRPVFIYSTIHTLSLLITAPLGIAVTVAARFRARN